MRLAGPVLGIGTTRDASETRGSASRPGVPRYGAFSPPAFISGMLDQALHLAGKVPAHRVERLERCRS